MIERLSIWSCWSVIGALLLYQLMYYAPVVALAGLSGLALLGCAVAEGLIVAMLALGVKLRVLAVDPQGDRGRRRLAFVLYALAVAYPWWDVVPWLVLGAAVLRLVRRGYVGRIATAFISLEVVWIATRMDTSAFSTRERQVAIVAFGVGAAVLSLHAVLAAYPGRTAAVGRVGNEFPSARAHHRAASLALGKCLRKTGECV